MADLIQSVTDWRNNQGAVWIWLGVLVLLFNHVVLGMGNPNYMAGLLSGLGFLSVGIVLSSARAGFLASICAALIGLLAVAVQTGWAQLGTGLTFSVLLFIGLLLNELGVLELGRSSAAKYAMLTAIGAWFLCSLLYLTQSWPNVPFEVLLYRGGIMLLAGVDFLSFLGAWTFNHYEEARLLLALVAIAGAYATVAMLGVGLSLTGAVGSIFLLDKPEE